MWLITVALSAGHVGQFSRSCQAAFGPGWWYTGCHFTSGILVLSVLSWLSRTFPLSPLSNNLHSRTPHSQSACEQ